MRPSSFEFSRFISLMGGPLHKERLSIIERQFHERVEDLIRSDFELWSRVFFEIDFVWIHNESLMGFADVENGRYKVALSYGAGLAFLKLFHFLWSLPSFFPNVGHAATELATEETVRQGFGISLRRHDAAELRKPRCPIRLEAANRMFESALLFLLHHEIAHIIRGHADYARRNGFAPLGDHPRNQQAAFPHQQVLENDADAVGIDFLIRIRAKELLRYNEPKRDDRLRDFFTALAILFAVMDQDDPGPVDRVDGPYAPPLHRFFATLDFAAGSLRSEFGISPDVIRPIAKEAVLETQKVAASLGVPANRWRNPTADDWRVDVYEQRKAATAAAIEQLLEGRSTLSDDVLERLRP